MSVTPNIEPSFLQEYHQCTSEYVIPQKEDSSAISSNGEFEAAQNLRSLNEDASEILVLEEKEAFLRNNPGLFFPSQQAHTD